MLNGKRVLRCNYVTRSESDRMQPGDFYSYISGKGVVFRCPWCGQPHKIGVKGDKYNKVKVEWFTMTLEKPFKCVKCKFECNIVNSELEVLSEHGK